MYRHPTPTEWKRMTLAEKIADMRAAAADNQVKLPPNATDEDLARQILGAQARSDALDDEAEGWTEKDWRKHGY